MSIIEYDIDKKLFSVEIEVGEIKIQKSSIEQDLGYHANLIPAFFSEILDDIINKLPSMCNIQAGYRILDLEKPVKRNDSFIIGGVLYNVHKIVFSQLKKSTHAAVFLCTIGDKMEIWSKQLFNESDPAASFLVDKVASATVENATDLLHDLIGKKMAEDGLSITNRYSPGFCNWSVSEQNLLFSLLPENFCGIKLSESSLMQPIKSVSGIIGIGKDVTYQEYICDRCGVKDCTHRIKRLEIINNKL